MGKIVNNFIKGRMNKDLDDRLVPNGEYRNAVNAQISRSEGENVGALENTLGNILVGDYRTLTGVNDLFSIGYLTDEVNNRIFSFLTNNDQEAYQASGTAKDEHYVYVYNILTGQSNELVAGAFLNFSTLYPITGVNILEDLLFWTDNRNQPRKLNVDLAINSVGAHSAYYSTEDHISIAKYNPYQTIELYNRSNDLTTSVATSNYETTMYNVTSKYYPDGGSANIDGTVDPAAQIFDLTTSTIQGDIPVGATVGYIHPTTGKLIDTGETVDSIDYRDGVVPPTIPTTSELNLSGNVEFTDSDIELIFNFNPYYENDYNGDKDYLKKKFARFSYRYKFVDGEYSIMAPFTQDCFIPRQDGYFMYKVSQAQDTALANYRSSQIPIEIEDEEDTYRSTTIDFMENKVDKIVLRIPLPSNSSSMETSLHVEEIDILYKESDSNTINVIESIGIDDIEAQYMTCQVDGNQGPTTTFDIMNINGTGAIQIGDTVTFDSENEITDYPTVIAFNGTDAIEFSTTQTLTNLNLLRFNSLGYFEYEYQAKKPYKVLPSEESTRTYDRVPVKALSQEIISNRVVYGNFQNKHTPPSSLDYNVAVSEKADFDLGLGTTTIRTIEAIGQTTLDIQVPTGTYNPGAIVTSSVTGAIPADTVLVSYNSVGPTITISNELAVGLSVSDVINFAAPNSVRYNTSYIEYPDHSLKTNRSYQVGVVLSDRYGRSSTVILSKSDNSVNYNNIKYLGSTVFTDYIDGDVNTATWPGNSLKVLFNNTISAPSITTGAPGLYNGDVTSVNYNPLGWYTYKIVVKQTEQEYYNVYLPGVMAGYPDDINKELGKTSHAVIINDNINKVPRDLTEVGPEQRQFRSSVVLHGRVQNNPDGATPFRPSDSNRQFYPGAFPSIVSTIGTDNDLFDGANDPGYVPAPEFYAVASDPLIARINTPSKQFGLPAVITTAEIDSIPDAGEIKIVDPSPCTNAYDCILPGMTVSGEGIAESTKVIAIIIDGGGWIITTEPQTSAALTASGTLTFMPTTPYVSPTGTQYLDLPNLAIMETDPVESNLDIFWETTTTGLISELNTAIENDTNATASLSGFDATTFAESLNKNVNILNTNFTLQDQFGNNIAYIAQNPPQLQLISVMTGTGIDVGPGSGNPLFALDDNGDGSYNVDLLDYLYYSSNTALRTYYFNFELNTFDSTTGAQVTSYETQMAALTNEVPTIVAERCTDVTYIPGTDGGGIGTIIVLPGLNGAYNDLGDNPKEELSWSAIPITVTNSDATAANYGVEYGPNGLGYVVVDESTLATGRFYFWGADPPPDMIDGVYECIATAEDGGSETVQCEFDLTINRTPCYTWEFVYQDTGNTITGANYTDCEGETQTLEDFTDQSVEGPPCASSTYYVCARDTATTQTGIRDTSGFVRLSLIDSDPCNNCNG